MVGIVKLLAVSGDLEHVQSPGGMEYAGAAMGVEVGNDFQPSHASCRRAVRSGAGATCGTGESELATAAVMHRRQLGFEAPQMTVVSWLNTVIRWCRCSSTLATTGCSASAEPIALPMRRQRER